MAGCYRNHRPDDPGIRTHLPTYLAADAAASVGAATGGEIAGAIDPDNATLADILRLSGGLAGGLVTGRVAGARDRASARKSYVNDAPSSDPARSTTRGSEAEIAWKVAFGCFSLTGGKPNGECRLIKPHLAIQTVCKSGCVRLSKAQAIQDLENFATEPSRVCSLEMQPGGQIQVSAFRKSKSHPSEAGRTLRL